MNNVEKRVNSIERALKTLKASYPTIGQNVRFYVQESQEFSVALSAGRSKTVRIKFVPDYGAGTNIISLRPIITINGSGVYMPSETEVQDGSGAVVVRVELTASISSANFKIVVVASGTLPGKFYMV